MWVGIIQPMEGLKRTKRERKGKFVLSLRELAHLFSPAITHPVLLVQKPSDSDKDLRPQFPWFSGLQTRPELHAGFPGSPACRHRSWDFLTSLTMGANSYNKSPPVSTHPHTSCWFCFSGEPCLTQLYPLRFIIFSQRASQTTAAV